MPDDLFQAAGENFSRAGETATRSGEAETQRKEAQNKPGIEAGAEVGATLRTAMGDKARLKEIQQQAAVDIQSEMIKHKMGLVKFPPALAIYYARKYKSPVLMQLSGQEMPVEMTHAIAETLGKNYRSGYPKFSGNMMVTLDEDGNEKTINLEDQGFHYKPAGKEKTPGGGPDKDQLNADKVWFKEYDSRKKWLTSDEGRMTQRKDPDKYNRESAFVEDNAPKADEIMHRLESSGESVDAGGASGGTITDQDWNAVFSGTKK